MRLSDIYRPPWRDPATRPAPRTWGAYERMLREWEQTREGGGLWDEEAARLARERRAPRR